jgi:type II secretory ATPase GspE/PulE/Tfp pilus assembly ATPase PilB-like protein
MFGSSRRIFGVVLALALALALAPRVSGTEVRMKDGMVYSGATVLRRDATSIQIHTAYGNVPLQLSQVAAIDGVRVAASPSPASATPARLPAVPLPSAAAAPSATASMAPGPSPAKPAAASIGTPSPTTVARPDSTGSSASQVSSRFRMYALIVLLVLGFVVYRLAVQVWRGRRARPTGNHQTAFEFLDENHNPIVIQVGEEASGIENAKDVVKDALLDRASDVHIEPSSSEYRVRFRIDGLMHPRMKFPPAEGIRLVAAIKTLAQIDIADRRKAQDGRFGAKTRGRVVDFRVATTPTVFGEKLVLRILDHKAGLRGLGDLGMSQTMLERFAEVIHSRSGMILATGPTGSGKTSTLYAALSQLDSDRLNLVTIEDPVEYQLDGATQIPVNVRAGITYESGLRSILRQDPDVILVGEMRDLEAAQIALRSALTGHLVFSSLHTRDAIGTITRLEEIGIERHLIASALFVVLAQRLVRILCPHCRASYECAGNELAGISIALPAGETIFRAVGCRKCEGTGYIGRTGAFEMLVLDEELRQAVTAGVAENALTELARHKGYREYREDAAEKVLLGITSVDEVLQAV